MYPGRILNAWEIQGLRKAEGPSRRQRRLVERASDWAGQKPGSWGEGPAAEYIGKSLRKFQGKRRTGLVLGAGDWRCQELLGRCAARDSTVETQCGNAAGS